MSVFQSFLFAVVSFLTSIVGVICGIGGGPINLVVLYYFFSMDTPRCAKPMFCEKIDKPPKVSTFGGISFFCNFFGALSTGT